MAKIIAPSILSADFAKLGDELRDLQKAGADWIHVDVMDGHFVPNLTIGVPVVASLRSVTNLPLDVHLMITHPGNYIEQFVRAGASYLTLHIESEGNIPALLRKIRELGCKAGITLRPGTAVELLLPLLGLVDLVLVMTVEPGFGGQSFREDQVGKIDQLKKWRDQNQWKYLIEVDGGLNNKTIKECKNADVIVAGSYVFSGDYSERITQLKDQG